MRRAIVDTTYVKSDASDSIQIPTDYVERAREALLQNTTVDDNSKIDRSLSGDLSSHLISNMKSFDRSKMHKSYDRMSTMQ